MSSSRTYRRLLIVEPAEVLKYLPPKYPDYRFYLDYLIDMRSLRYFVFKYKGMQCVKCGIKGNFFSLEKAKHDYTAHVPHFNLYNISDDFKFTLMTKDHILPRSKGGSDLLSNMQCMCEHCNSRKGNTVEDPSQYSFIKPPRRHISDVTVDAYVQARSTKY